MRKESYHDQEYFARTAQTVIANRKRIVDGLLALGFDVLPSAANFVFARHSQWRGEKLAQTLRDRAVLVRHFKGERTDDYVRITVGSELQNQALLAALVEILKQ